MCSKALNVHSQSLIEGMEFSWALLVWNFLKTWMQFISDQRGYSGLSLCKDWNVRWHLYHKSTSSLSKRGTVNRQIQILLRKIRAFALFRASRTWPVTEGLNLGFLLITFMQNYESPFQSPLKRKKSCYWKTTYSNKEPCPHITHINK